MDKQKVIELKSQVYDCLKTIEVAQAKLQQLNQAIRQEEAIPDEKPKEEK